MAWQKMFKEVVALVRELIDELRALRKELEKRER